MTNVLRQLLVVHQLLEENTAGIQRHKKEGEEERAKRKKMKEEQQEKKISPSLVVEVVNVLHVAEDDVLLAGDACRNLLHTVGHLPQVCLRNTVTVKNLIMKVHSDVRVCLLTSRHS